MLGMMFTQKGVNTNDGKNGVGLDPISDDDSLVDSLLSGDGGGGGGGGDGGDGGDGRDGDTVDVRTREGHFQLYRNRRVYHRSPSPAGSYLATCDRMGLSPR